MNLTLVIDEDDAETCRIMLEGELQRGWSYEKQKDLYTHIKEGVNAYVVALDAAFEEHGGREARQQHRRSDLNLESPSR